MKRKLPQESTLQDTNHDDSSDDGEETPNGHPTDSNLNSEINEERLVWPYPTTRDTPLFTYLDYFVIVPKLFHPRPEWYIPIPSPSSPSSSLARTAMFGNHCDCAVSYCLRQYGTNGEEAALVLLRDYDAPAHEADTAGVTPLLLALEKGALAVVDYLLPRPDGVELAMHMTNDERTSVRVAAEYGHVDMLKKILTLVPATSRKILFCSDLDRVTPMMAACRVGHLAVVQCLVQWGREATYYIRSNDHRKPYQLLIELRKPFLTAIEHGHIPIVQYLLEYGRAHVDYRLHYESGYRRQSALNWAFQTGIVDMVKVLVSHGCNLAVQFSQSETLLDVAEPDMVMALCPQNQVYLLQQQRRKEWIRRLIRTYYLVQQGRALYLFPGFPSMETLWNQDEKHGLKSAPGLVAAKSIMKDRRLVCPKSDSKLQVQLKSTDDTLLRMMTLPFPLVKKIINYMPAPLCWDERINIVTNRTNTQIEPPGAKTEAIHSSLDLTLDLLDEVFEHAGFLHACDEAGIPVWPSLSPFEVRYQHSNNYDGYQSVLDLYANNKDLDLSKVQLLLNGENSDKPQDRSYWKGPVGFKNWTSCMRWCKRHCPKFRRQEACTDDEGNGSTLIFKHSANAVVDAFGRKQQPLPFSGPSPPTEEYSYCSHWRDSITHMQRPSPFSNPLVIDLLHRNDAWRWGDCGTGDDSSDDGMPVVCRLVTTPPLPTMIEIQRYVNYPAMLERHWDKLVPILTRSPYNIPTPLLDQLLVCVDFVRLSRRLGSAGNGSNNEIRNIVHVHGARLRRRQGFRCHLASPGVTFSSKVVQDMIRLVSDFVRWYKDNHGKRTTQLAT